MAGLFGNQPPPPRTLLGGYLPKTPPQPPLVHATAKGASGRTYQFQIAPVGTSYYERPGVYMFLKRGGGIWAAVYIGETDNFDRRLNKELVLHHRWQSIRAEGATHIGTLHVPGGGLALREAIETDLRRAIVTPCNRQ